jgi:hypothetical protein
MRGTGQPAKDHHRWPRHEFVKKRQGAAERRLRAAESASAQALRSEAEQRDRAERVEERLAQAEARLALPPKRQCSCSRRVELALRRLARNPAVAKKLVLAVHPDKCPAALSDSATDLLRLVQRVREANGHANT